MVDNFNPWDLYTLGTQAFLNYLDVFPLNHDLLQARITKMRLYDRGRCACRFQFLSETFCVKEENLEAGYVSNSVVVAESGFDGNRAWRTLPRWL